MNLTLRPFVAETDAPLLVRMYNTVATEPITVEHFTEWEEKFPADGFLERWAVLTPSGEVAGFGEVARVPWSIPGRFYAEGVVDPVFRRQGVGSLMLEHAEQVARAHGMQELRTSVRDHEPAFLRFFQNRGFVLDRHIFESTLDLASFDASRFAGAVDAVRASGIRFFTLADEPGEANERKLWEFDKKTVTDIPGWDAVGYPEFEQWRKDHLEGANARFDCIIIAADGDQFVGTTKMQPVPKSGAMYTHYTAVDPAYRGRKIALALKLLAVETARRYGAPYMRTNNDSKNAPILAVNRKMGYVPAPGEHRLNKRLA